MEFQFGKHVKVVCDLQIGDKVRTDGWGPKLDGKDWIIEDIQLQLHTESGVIIKINGYPSYIDSNWIDKITNKLV